MVACAATLGVSQTAPPPMAPLAEGTGKDVVQRRCLSCHLQDRITRSRFSKDRWEYLVAQMESMGAVIPKEDKPVIVAYLATNYLGDPLPIGKVIPGPVEASIREWKLPTPGSHPHDPAVAPDGSIWYTGQYRNLMGRLDPKTGEIKEYPLQRPKSGPHGTVADKEGNIWFTGNAAGYIGKLDPKTGAVTEYPMPDPAAKDPHTAIFDKTESTLWFTVQHANMVGKLDPKTGEIKLVKVPTPASRPYGILMSSTGVPIFCEFGTNKLASIDPKTMEIKEYILPNPETRPRRIALTSDDVIWYTDYSRGYLGKYDPKTGQTKEWLSPGGPRSLPYGITSVNDVLWYSEAGVEQNTMLRFDPKTEKFQSWAIPSGVGIVRNMTVSPDGNLVFHQSSNNRVGLVIIEKPAAATTRR